MNQNDLVLFYESYLELEWFIDPAKFFSVFSPEKSSYVFIAERFLYQNARIVAEGIEHSEVLKRTKNWEDLVLSRTLFRINLR